MPRICAPWFQTRAGGHCSASFGSSNPQVNHQLVLRALSQFPAFRTSISIFIRGTGLETGVVGGDTRPPVNHGAQPGPEPPRTDNHGRDPDRSMRSHSSRWKAARTRCGGYIVVTRIHNRVG